MILVTGCAGFIGFHVSSIILKNKKNKILGLDNLNNYYDVNLKKNRLKILKKKKNFFFYKVDLLNKKKLFNLVKKNKIKIVIHLAAQAGVRYSILKPEVYVDSNIKGFLNILEACRHFKIKNLIYASTSSVYGLSTKIPFKENENNTNHPMQLYAATKKSNELMAHAYSWLFNIPTTGLRFFTVYGPWGRPDMSLFKFTKNIIKNKKIDLYNNGNHARDFTYVEDVAKIIYKLIKKPSKKNKFWLKKNSSDTSLAPYKILNISCGRKISLKKFVLEIEKNLNKKSKKNYLPMQMGDIKETLSSKKNLNKYFPQINFTNYKIGIKNFVNWYMEYFKIDLKNT
jgi:UDP-glucuronate 4-epimerase